MDSYGNIHPPQMPEAYLPSAVADEILAALPEEVRVPIPDTGLFWINKDHVPALAELLHEVIAYTVASIIDAGSERDAVIENEELRNVLEAELCAWTEGG